MTYAEFKTKLNTKIFTDDLHYEILIKAFRNPERYIGLFRITNAKTKLIQNLTQSCEIKFGNFIEDILTDFIVEMGYEILEKNIGKDERGNNLNVDQLFTKKDAVYLIEQKVRDDHDSTKKRGQYSNFIKKIKVIKASFPNKKIIASMWFSDDSLQKNKKYYSEMIDANTDTDVEIHLYYGAELFEKLFLRLDIWEQLVEFLKQNKKERANEILSVPDFDTSGEIRTALLKIKKENPTLIKKLFSNDKKYIQLREELFHTGKNLEGLL